MSARSACAATLLLLGTAGLAPVTAQGRFGDEETRLLREAAALESDRNLAGAEQTLLRLLQIDPTSTGAVYALERVLRAQDRVGDVLGPVDAFLSRRENAGIRSLKLQVLVEVDSVDAMVEEAERWIARAPRDEMAYMEVARAYEAAFGPARALQVLTDGRARLGGDSLALAMGDYHADRGDLEAAADEWALAIGRDGSNVLVVRRRVESLGEGETVAGRRLVSALAASDVPARREAATRLALELGLAAEALELARNAADDLEGFERTEYLQEISVAATAAGVAQVASWAYAELGAIEDNPGERRLIDQRRAEAELLAGDTTAALDALARVARSLPAGSSDRRLVEARSIRLAALATDVDRLKSLWASFREAYASAPELDPLAAVTASTLLAWGDADGAIEVLDGVEGPHSALERAYLLLGGGEVAMGRGALMQAAGGLPPSEATEVIQLAALLGRVSGEGALSLATAAVQAHLGRGAQAATTLAEEAFGLPAQEESLLLAEAARMADRAGASQSAARIRQRLVAEYPDAPEAAEAMLALARHRAVQGNAAEAIRLLEDLITRQPGAAVVPDARLELERLRS